MLAFGQHNHPHCGGLRTQFGGLQPSLGPLIRFSGPLAQFGGLQPILGPSAQFWGLQPCFGAFSPDLGHSALIWGIQPSFGLSPSFGAFYPVSGPWAPPQTNTEFTKINYHDISLFH